MKLIGAGLPRTATTTQMIALEMLGLPCYHMRDMMADLGKSVPQWRQALEGDGQWDEIFEGKESTVDFPASYFWRELMDVYPDAKVLLSVRTAESWVDMLFDMWTKRGMLVNTNGDSDMMATQMEEWNQEVIDTVPAERLLVWNPKDGWDPLCDFLELPVPAEPLPHVNDTENFQKALMMGPAIAAINEWWEREKPQPVPA